MSTVLITGAGRGIGRAITEEFIRRGHRVIGTARDPRSLEGLDLAQRLALDVTDDASVAAAEIADAAEKPQLPLRLPIGDAARAVLAARRAAPDDVPFVPTAG